MVVIFVEERLGTRLRLQLFLRFSKYFLLSYDPKSLSRLSTRVATRRKRLFYYKSSPALLVANKTFTKMSYMSAIACNCRDCLKVFLLLSTSLMIQIRPILAQKRELDLKSTSNQS